MSAASIQAKRGHIGIEAIVGLLAPRVDHWRQLCVDVASFPFCAFFALKSWLLLAEAWEANFPSAATWVRRCGAATPLVMFTGMPIAFALVAVATTFMILFMPAASVDTI